MATLESIAIRNEQALARLRHAVETLASNFGVETAEIPDQYRDPAELPTMQLEAMADFLERVVSVSPTSEAEQGESDGDERTLREQFAQMGKDDVLALAASNGMEVTSRTTKTEAVDWLVANAHNVSANDEAGEQRG
jgi:hypothetical protein